ncbi:hypothetical protein [Blackfly microvirus SF02]|uniref:Uncharacterized protein n=1 Tax=Blackfly microvirus SF02 TaxID=2576452 RepID=A0A4P8PPI2_9VIRU|nr:hypothetical protein [Blackfly microvirus SF02]
MYSAMSNTQSPNWLLQLLNWLKSHSTSLWTKIASIAIVIILALIFFLSSCTSSHSVIQSSYNATTGDSIVIRYEQIGRTIRP